jgi:hypothetical protein
VPRAAILVRAGERRWRIGRGGPGTTRVLAWLSSMAPQRPHTGLGPAPWLLAATLAACGHPQSREVSSSVASVATYEAEAAAVRVAAAPRAFQPSEDAVRASLGSAAIERVALGKGGRSVSFKITLVDGTVGYFKPEQGFAAHWYAELAAYYVDRALGLHRVPPAIGRRIPWSELRVAAERSKHARELKVQADGTVRGAFVWWVPERLVPLDPPKGWEAWLGVDAPPAVSPFVRHGEYRRALARASRGRARTASASVPPPSFADRPAELADLVLFDVLIDNADRWGGNFTNVRTRGKDGPLVFLDNAGGFHRGREPDARTRAQLAAVQRMRASTIEALRELDMEELRAAMADDPLAPVLTEVHFEQLKARRRMLLAHAERMAAQHGAESTPW